MATTIAACLATINVTLDQLGGDLADEWKLIKKSYFRACLDNHPDKGGDASAFRKVQRAFEALRALFDRGAIASFGDNAASTSVDTAVAGSEAEVPSWEFYADAAEEPVPIYRVEPAKSHRSKCTAKGAAKKCDGCIEKGALRVGYLNIETGTYGSWKNLSCWRVPSKVWLGLPDPDKVSDSNAFKAALISMSSVVLSGAGELEAEDALAFTAHCMDKTTWARLVKRKESTAQAADKHGAADGGQSAPTAPALPPPYSSAGLPVLVGGRVAASSAISVDKRFVIPVPGKDGPANSLAGKTVVLTGVFPEVGGGAGLDLGKARVKAMVEAFGGKVTGSVSGRTDVLIVGKEPGASKVGKAQSSGTCTLMSLLDVRKGLEVRVSRHSSSERVRRSHSWTNIGVCPASAEGCWLVCAIRAARIP